MPLKSATVKLSIRSFQTLLGLLFQLSFVSLRCKLGGARSCGAEMIPLKPDAGNAAEGKAGKFLHYPPFLFNRLSVFCRQRRT